MTVEQILLRADTAAQWTAVNPVLALREPGAETDTRRLKIGDGVTAWSSLPYAAVPPSDLTDANTPTGGALKVAYGSGAPEYIAPPASLLSAWTTLNPQAWWGANGALFHRFSIARPTPLRYINFHIGTASGNIQVGIVKLSPTNMLAWTAMVASSGVIACPAAGPQHLDLGAGLVVQPGEYAVFFWADNITMTTAHDLGSVGVTASRMAMSGTYAGGIAASGAASFTNRYVIGLTLESV